MLLAFTAGCNTLPPGSIQSAISRSTSTAPTIAIRQAFLLRGWRGLWSEGIDKLAVELRAAGVDAHVFRADQARDLGDALVERYRGPGPNPPIVLIGFSYGADGAIEIARRLENAGIAVDLLVTIEPVTPPPVPGNVKVCRNYYQSNGVWDVFPWLRGVPLEASDKRMSLGRVINIDVRNRPDLLEPGTSHATIAANARLHQAILEDVRKRTAMCPASANPPLIPATRTSNLHHSSTAGRLDFPLTLGANDLSRSFTCAKTDCVPECLGKALIPKRGASLASPRLNIRRTANSLEACSDRT